MRYDYLAVGAGKADEPVPLPVLRQRVDRAWAAFQTSRYSILGPQLPQLLTASQLATQELGGDAKLRASGLLAESYQLAAILLLKLGESNAAWVAADRGILAAERAEDPLVVASGARILAYAFLGAGHFAKAKDLTISAAGVLEPGLGSASPAHLSLYGALLLKGAMAAAHQGDPITSRALLNEAASTADRLEPTPTTPSPPSAPPTSASIESQQPSPSAMAERPSSTPRRCTRCTCQWWSGAPST
jgi:hypothetical protein